MKSKTDSARADSPSSLVKPLTSRKRKTHLETCGVEQLYQFIATHPVALKRPRTMNLAGVFVSRRHQHAEADAEALVRT